MRIKSRNTNKNQISAPFIFSCNQSELEMKLVPLTEIELPHDWECHYMFYTRKWHNQQLMQACSMKTHSMQQQSDNGDTAVSQSFLALRNAISDKHSCMFQGTINFRNSSSEQRFQSKRRNATLPPFRFIHLIPCLYYLINVESQPSHVII